MSEELLKLPHPQPRVSKTPYAFEGLLLVQSGDLELDAYQHTVLFSFNF